MATDRFFFVVLVSNRVSYSIEIVSKKLIFPNVHPDLNLIRSVGVVVMYKQLMSVLLGYHCLYISHLLQSQVRMFLAVPGYCIPEASIVMQFEIVLTITSVITKYLFVKVAQKITISITIVKQYCDVFKSVIREIINEMRLFYPFT